MSVNVFTIFLKSSEIHLPKQQNDKRRVNIVCQEWEVDEAGQGWWCPRFLVHFVLISLISSITQWYMYFSTYLHPRFLIKHQTEFIISCLVLSLIQAYLNVSLSWRLLAVRTDERMDQGCYMDCIISPFVFQDELLLQTYSHTMHPLPTWSHIRLCCILLSSFWSSL